MDILYLDRRTESLFNSRAKLLRKFKQRRADLIMLRLSQLQAADRLADMKYYPQAKCEALKHQRSGLFSVRLDGPYRLIFQPAHNPLPLHSGGNVDWTRVTAVYILCVEDYHD